jgi:hypothetical protein
MLNKKVGRLLLDFRSIKNIKKVQSHETLQSWGSQGMRKINLLPILKTLHLCLYPYL